jgi:membrane protein required for colicin V production
MTWLDYAVAGVCAVSVAVGVWRGLVRETISLAGWVIAFLAANLFAAPLALLVPEAIPTPELRTLAAFAAIFVATLVVASLLALVLSRLTRAIGLGGLDRALGALFGAARALLVLGAFALLAGLTSLPREPAWKNSFVGPWLGAGALAARPWLPPAFAGRLRYD